MSLRLRALLLLIGLSTASTLPVAAAIGHTLRAVTVEPGSRISIAFDGGVPDNAAVVLQGTITPTLLLSETRVGPSVVSSLPTTRDVSKISIQSVGNQLRIVFYLARPSVISVDSSTERLILRFGPSEAGAPGGIATADAGASIGRTAGKLVHKVVQLNYADASEVASVITGQSVAPGEVLAAIPMQVGIAGSPAFSGPSYPQQSVPGPVFSAIGSKASEQVSVDRRLNAVVLTGSAEEVADLVEYVSMLDKAVDSVSLETEIVELNEQAVRNLGISFGAGQPIATGSFQARNNQSPATSLTIQSAIYAEISRGNGRILARPRIVAQNNTAASIVTGEQIPLITSITYPGANTVVQQQVQYVNVGISLQVQPRIASDGNVTAKVISQVSSVSGYVQGYPQISQRQASTTASVADGTAFIIGGLVQDAELRSLSKVPGIGDLPIIGSLFRHLTTSKTHIDLYILITPHIVRHASATR